jgi:hypothetical protein
MPEAKFGYGDEFSRSLTGENETQAGSWVHRARLSYIYCISKQCPNEAYSDSLSANCRLLGCAVKRRWSTAGVYGPGTGSLHPVAIRAAVATRMLKPLVQRVARRLGERAGRNVSERRAGPENSDAGADPPRFEGRLKLMELYERTNSIRPAGVVATACRQRGPSATREVPAVIAVWINWQLARDRPGRLGWWRGPLYR